MLRRAFPCRQVTRLARCYAAPFVPKREPVVAAAPVDPIVSAEAKSSVDAVASAASAATSGVEPIVGRAAPAAAPPAPGAPIVSRAAPVVTPVVPPSAPPEAPIVPPRAPKPKSFRNGLLLGLLAGIVWGVYDNSILRLDDANTVQPPTKCEPFPTSIKLDNVPFTCLGVGVRTVSFLKLHVYAVGIYIATEDIAKAKTALVASNASSASLFDDELSVDVIDQVLRSGVRVAVRITPVRNTEFGHLRDGFVRSIMNHPMFKELNDDAFGEGLGQIKRAFGRKRKAPKGDTIYMVRTKTGGLKAEYLNPDGSLETLGEVDNINVARVFFLQYLSGKAPNSPSAREDAARGLLQLV